MKKRLAAILCALALFCALALPAWGSSGSTTVYLLAVNDKFYDGYRPVAVNGVIYIPYTTFDRNATGVDLGVYYGITSEPGGTILTLYALSGMLTFNVKMGTCEDNLGNTMDFHAVSRGNPLIPYVPAAAVCDFFGLQYSFLPTTDRGTLIRITNAASSMSDGFFLGSAKSAMLHRYNQVIQSQNPQPTPPAATASPAPTSTPNPSGSSGGKEHVRVYLAVEAYRTDQDLTDYYSSSTQVLFLFTPASLPSHASAVRRAVAAGHSIGLVVEGTAEEAQQQLEQGNQLLGHIARVNTHIVSAPPELTAALTAEGWICWQPNVAGGDLMASLDTKRSVGYVNAPIYPGSISRFLSQLRSAGYDLRRPLEPELA